MIRYSNSFKGQTKRLKLDPKHRAIADLMLVGWNVTDAYLALGMYNATFSDEHHKIQMAQITDNADFAIYMQKKERALKQGYKGVPDSVKSDEEASSDCQYRTKDEVLNGLIAELPNLRGKDKADVLMKIADLQQMKKEEIVEEDNTVHFYVPVTCHMCDLYSKEKMRLERQRKRESATEEDED